MVPTTPRSTVLSAVEEAVIVEFRDDAGKMNGAGFLRGLISASPYAIHTVLTDNGMAFADQPKNRGRSPAMAAVFHIFDRVWKQHGIQHKLTRPYHQWTNGQAERMNRTVFPLSRPRKPQSPRPCFRVGIRLRQAPQGHSMETPFEAICLAWTNRPEIFKLDPRHLIPGPNTQTQRCHHSRVALIEGRSTWAIQILPQCYLQPSQWTAITSPDVSVPLRASPEVDTLVVRMRFAVVSSFDRHIGGCVHPFEAKVAVQVPGEVPIVTLKSASLPTTVAPVPHAEIAGVPPAKVSMWPTPATTRGELPWVVTWQGTFVSVPVHCHCGGFPVSPAWKRH